MIKTFEVTTEDGKVHEVDVDDGQPDPSLKDQIPKIASEAVQAANPLEQTKKFFATDPATMQRQGGSALPIVGGALGGPIGASLGEVARQASGAVLAPDTVPKTPLGVGASVMGAGVMQDPKILGASLNAVPGVPAVAKMASDLGSKVASSTGKGLAKAAQAFSGGKAGDFVEAAKKGYKTYAAPSIEKASQKFGEALKGLPGKDIAPTMKETIEAAVTPESSAGNKFLADVGERIDKGELITARQALKAKQSLDAVIDTVPVWQTKRRAKLFDLKTTFDDVLSSQSGELKSASNDYRAAKLKENMLKFLPVNKHGEYSRLAALLSTVAGTGKAIVASPLTMGALATTGGEVTRGLTKLGQNPETRQALLQILDKIKRKEEAPQ